MDKIGDTQFRTVPESVSSEDENTEPQTTLDEEEQQIQAIVKEERSSVWIHLFYAFSIWGDKCHEFALYLSIAYTFPTTLLIGAMFAVSALLMPLLLSSPIAAMIDKYPRFPLLGTSTGFTKLSMILIYVCLALLYRMCGKEIIFPIPEDQQKSLKQLFNPVCIFTSLGLIVLTAIHSFCYLLSNAAFTKDWLVVIKSITKEHGGDTTFLESNLKKQNVVSKILAPFAVAAIIFGLKKLDLKVGFELSPLEITLGLMCVWTLLSGVVEIVLLRKISNLYPELRDNVGIPMMPQNPEEFNRAESRSLNIEEEAPSFCRQIMKPWILFGKHKILLAALSFTIFFVSTLAPGPLLTTYLKFRNINDLEIAAFHGAAPILSAVGSKVIPFLTTYLPAKPVFLICIWLLPITAIAAVVQLFLADKPVELHTWVLLGVIIFSRAPSWGIEFIEYHVLKNYVQPQDLGILKGIQWMCGNAFHILGYIIGLSVCYTVEFNRLAVVSATATLITAVLFSVWVILHGKELSDKVIVERETQTEDPRKEHTVMNEGDLNFDNSMSEISSETD